MAKAKRPPQTRKKLGGPRVGEGGPRRDKVAAVEDIQGRMSGASAVVLTEYRGMTVSELAELRSSLREVGADYKVYKNTLATIAVRNLGLDGLTEQLEGPTAFTFAGADPVVAAKRLSDYAKKVPALVIKGGIFEKKILSSSEVDSLAKLESREVLLTKMVSVFQAPIQQLANLLSTPLNNLGSLLAQLRDKLPDVPAAEDETTEG